jgi:hypothetical protein
MRTCSYFMTSWIPTRGYTGYYSEKRIKIKDTAQLLFVSFNSY